MPTKEEHMFNGMPIQEAVRHYSALVRKEFGAARVMFGGSRFFGDYGPDSDLDLVALVSSLKKLTIDYGTWVNCGTDDYGDNDDRNRIVLRSQGNINVILVDSLQSYNVWRRCTDVAKTLKLNKEQRACLFSTMRGDPCV